MGKGDKKSKRGKIFRGSFGKRRPKKKRNISSEAADVDKKSTRSSKSTPEKTEDKSITEA
jgi:30S ribosomal protein S31